MPSHREALRARTIADLAGLEEPYVIMGIGLPGSGKTTFLSDIAKRLDLPRIARDDIREELTRDATDRSMESTVLAEAHQRVNQELAAGHSVIQDGTNTHLQERREAIDIWRQHGALAVMACVFDVPADLAKVRNTSRDRVVDTAVIDSMYTELVCKPPSVSEGFDLVVRV